jgi:hypothetical protein
MLKDAIKNRDYDPNIDAYGLNAVEKEELKIRRRNNVSEIAE